MSVYKPQKSPFYSYDFQLHGRRFHGSTRTKNRKEAEQVERRLKAKAKADLDNEAVTGVGPLTLDNAAGRYWKEVGEGHANKNDTARNLERLIEFFGAEKRIDEITDADVAALIAWRRKQNVIAKRRSKVGELVDFPLRTITPSTVNRTALVPLKAIFSRARRTWRYTFPKEPIWRDHALKEPIERVREVHQHEDDALYAVLRCDYAPWLEFVRITGLRLTETLIRWENVNWFSRIIATTGKGGRKVTTHITPEVEAILKPLVGDHPVWVFTYVCQCPRKAKDKDSVRLQGQRYPITRAGAKSQWKRIKKAANLSDLRFHDFRHDTATRLLRETGSLKIVQKALNHSNITTTARYAHVSDDDLVQALSLAAKSRNNSRKNHRKNDGMED